jgi:hypothetical protein
MDTCKYLAFGECKVDNKTTLKNCLLCQTAACIAKAKREEMFDLGIHLITLYQIVAKEMEPKEQNIPIT